MINRQRSITPENLVGKIEMLMATGKDVILVEGLNDVTFFKKMFNPNRCRVIECNGKPNVIKLNKMLKQRKSKTYFGLVDSDFDNFLEVPEDDKIFRTDTHDIETMIIFNTKHFEDILYSYIDLEKYEKTFDKNIVDFIIDLAYKIGLVRLINHEKNWSIDFSQYNVEDLVSNKRAKSLKEIFSYFCRDQVKLIEFMNIVDTKGYYPKNFDLCRQLCCGHDIIKITIYTINTFSLASH